MISKRSLIKNTQTPPTIYCLESHDGRNSSEATWILEKLVSKRALRRKKDQELAALCIKIKTVCPVYFHSDRLKGSWMQLVSVSHAAHIFTTLLKKKGCVAYCGQLKELQQNLKKSYVIHHFQFVFPMLFGR